MRIRPTFFDRLALASLALCLTAGLSSACGNSNTETKKKAAKADTATKSDKGGSSRRGGDDEDGEGKRGGDTRPQGSNSGDAMASAGATATNTGTSTATDQDDDPSGDLDDLTSMGTSTNASIGTGLIIGGIDLTGLDPALHQQVLGGGRLDISKLTPEQLQQIQGFIDKNGGLANLASLASNLGIQIGGLGGLPKTSTSTSIGIGHLGLPGKP